MQNEAVPEDTVTIPIAASVSNDVTLWHKVTDGTPWNIYEDPDWQEEVNDFGFFGGEATLSVIIMSSEGSTTILPRMDWHFRIAGENSDETKCKTYINSVDGSLWYAYAIAKHETKDEGKMGSYNHFLDQGGQSSKVPGKEGVPDWNNDTTFKKDSGGHYILDGSGNRIIAVDAQGSGGYGLFQLTYASDDSNFIEPRGWVWDWQGNTQQFIVELNQKLSLAQSLCNGLAATYPASGAIPTHLHFTAIEATTITYYNGMSGAQLKYVRVNGYKKLQRTCWYPTAKGWMFLPNKNDYCTTVDQSLDP